MNIGLGGLLTVAFVVLKLTGVIAWSWWWVFSPLWIGFLLWLVLVIISVIAQDRAAQRQRQAMLNRYRRR